VNLTLSSERHGLLADCLAARAGLLARSARFALYDLCPVDRSGHDPAGIVVVHDFTPSEIDNNIGGFVAYELMPLLASLPRSGAPNGYALSEQETFERFVGAIVRSVDDNERRAWHVFYDNTLRALARVGRRRASAAGHDTPPQDFIATFAAIYDRAIEFIAEVRPRTWLDAATCFGFLPFHLSTRDRGVPPGDGWRPCEIFGCDENVALVALARDYARHRQLSELRFFQADLLAFEEALERTAAPPRCDVVTAIHVLEHLEPGQTAAALDTLWSCTGRRLIVAVPTEMTPDPRFGHRQVFDLSRLHALGHALDGFCHCFEDHGVWLVIDRLPQPQKVKEQDR